MATGSANPCSERWVDSKLAQLETSSPVQRFVLGARMLIAFRVFLKRDEHAVCAYM